MAETSQRKRNRAELSEVAENHEVLSVLPGLLPRDPPTREKWV